MLKKKPRTDLFDQTHQPKTVQLSAGCTDNSFSLTGANKIGTVLLRMQWLQRLDMFASHLNYIPTLTCDGACFVQGR